MPKTYTVRELREALSHVADADLDREVWLSVPDGWAAWNGTFTPMGSDQLALEC